MRHLTILWTFPDTRQGAGTGEANGLARCPTRGRHSCAVFSAKPCDRSRPSRRRSGHGLARWLRWAC